MLYGQPRSSRAAPLALVLAALSGSCASRTDHASSHSAFETVARHVRLLHNGRPCTWQDFLDRMQAADVLVLGETHKDETTHDVELAIVRAARGRAGRKVILGLEMFARDAQPRLDAYLAGQIGESQFLAKSRPWGNYKTGYRALVEFAKTSGIQVIGTNIPPALRRKVSRGGSDAIDSLAPAERKLLPPALRPNSIAYWKRYDRLAAGHLVRADAPSPDQRLYWGQCLWDNTMAWSCAEALAQNPGALLIHVNGSFHSNESLGLVEQLHARRPKADVCVVTIVPCLDPHTVPPARVGRLGEFVILAQRRGNGLDSGWNAVTAPAQVRFRVLHRPDAGTARHPLVVRMGTKPELEGIAGVVVEVEAARHWCRPDTFERDVEFWTHALSEIIRYVRQHEAVDDTPAKLVAHGRAATILARMSLAPNRAPHEAWAIDPAEYTKVGFATLPAPGSVNARLRVVTKNEDRVWWKELLEKFRAVGVDAKLVRREEVSADLRGRIQSR